jgi:ABC-type Mn2+/Zn2+ transport system ATPase subunit
MHSANMAVRMPNPEEAVERILDDVGLDAKFRGKLIRTYSTGMKRRVEIARALMGRPEVLFLDEPTRGLDLPTKRDMWSLLRRLRNVRRLQVRIVQATKASRWGRVRALQRLLTHSYSGKVLAVRRVTENNGKKTPGVDQEIWDTPEKKTQAVHALKAIFRSETRESCRGMSLFPP